MSTSSGGPNTLDSDVRTAAELDGLTERARDRLHLRRALRRALPDEELTIMLEPIVDLDTGRILGAEALLRGGPRQDTVSPEKFPPLAREQGDRLGPVGRWTLTTAASEVTALARTLERAAPLGVSLAVSGAQLVGAHLVEDVMAALRMSGLRPADLCLQIAQPTLLERLPAALTSLDAVRSHGVRVCIDDHWAGYASMLFVQHFHADMVRMRAGSAESAVTGRASREVMRSVISMGHSLGARVIAAGVDSGRVAAALAELGCDAAQGPHFAPPMAAGDLVVLCRREQRLWDERRRAGD